MSRGSEAGFTLLEVMVAFVVATVLLTVAFQVGGESFRAIGRGNDRMLAVLHARSILESAAIGEAIEIGERRGRTADGFIWRIKTSAAGNLGFDSTTRSARLLRLDVEVHPQDRPEDSIVLTSLRLASTPEAR